MQQLSNAPEYLIFMEWLQATHPELYVSCWKSVPPSDDRNAIPVSKKELDEKTYKAVIDAKFEYYKKNKS